MADFMIKVGDTEQLEVSLDGAAVNVGASYVVPDSQLGVASVTPGGFVTAKAPGLLTVQVYDGANNLRKTFIGIIQSAQQAAFDAAPHTVSSSVQGGNAPPPANFTGTYGSGGVVQFNWSAAPGASGYNIYNATTNAKIGTVAGGAASTLTLATGSGSYHLKSYDVSAKESTPALVVMP